MSKKIKHEDKTQHAEKTNTVEDIKTDEQAIQEKKAIRSQSYTSSVFLAANTIGRLHGNLDLITTLEQLIDSVTKVKNDNTNELEHMLVLQAKTLDYVFYEFLKNTSDLNMIDHLDVFTNIAFRAQNQCRKTLLALAQIKNPRQPTFIKQQNNAINQQVNNTMKPESTNSENSKKIANELLSEVKHETLDYRGTSETIGINQKMAAVEISRGENP